MKKGMESATLGVIVGIVLALILLFSSTNLFGSTAKKANLGFITVTPDKLTQCKVRGTIQGCDTNSCCGNSIYSTDCNPCLGSTAADFDPANSVNGMPKKCLKNQAQANTKKLECNYYRNADQCCVIENPCPGITCFANLPKDN